MPGLIRGVARTAAVAGTATAVSNRVSRRQQGRWAQQNPQEPVAAQPPPEEDTTSKMDKLKELGELKSQGVLTEAEFASEKRKILDS
ncbi:SHOCT domain-containing protein [Streptomyces canus]|uniref:SHOCT domain-containing protein n=1 Tax=Streptomyces canus TaxID=58343 RepID=UPI00224E0450|nr:SHOCT domain-containing protein [Streptomyces canus]MCX4855386.1 SHOCT domain-containing protein [Streptomyces canus]WSW39237.1 SHOCT domain-containing protein [Streptomyces canus]